VRGVLKEQLNGFGSRIHHAVEEGRGLQACFSILIPFKSDTSK